MTKEELIKQAERILSKINNEPGTALVEAKEFLKIYGGRDNSFEKSINGITTRDAFSSIGKLVIDSTLKAFCEFLKNDLMRDISIEREIQIDTVSDYLEQAEALLNDQKVHPAAPTVIIGASLEEFLRTWLEEEGFDISTINKNLESYSLELRRKDLITKQDSKDITSWSGIRNDAAHGHFTNVEDRNRIRIMLESVNLFMRKYSK